MPGELLTQDGLLAMKKDLQECESRGISSEFTADMSLKLMALKLYFAETEEAKLLWKRIPLRHKEAHPQLEKLLLICQAILSRDYIEIHKILESTKWPSDIGQIVTLSQERIRERTLNLVSYSYTSISTHMLSEMLNIPPAKLIERVTALNWTVDVDSGMVKPREAVQDSRALYGKETVDLASLTRLVSYLEN